jgi:hypothetical protein
MYLQTVFVEVLSLQITKRLRLQIAIMQIDSFAEGPQI